MTNTKVLILALLLISLLQYSMTKRKPSADVVVLKSTVQNNHAGIKGSPSRNFYRISIIKKTELPIVFDSIKIMNALTAKVEIEYNDNEWNKMFKKNDTINLVAVINTIDIVAFTRSNESHNTISPSSDKLYYTISNAARQISLPASTKLEPQLNK
jgi:hypothetical protein